MRQSLDAYFMNIAEVVATRATCPRRHVGAVLVKDKRIIATGYNGSPPGLPHCDDVGCELVEGHCVRTCHSEDNCLTQCARNGGDAFGCTLYSTASPCYLCFKRLLAAGVVRVVARDVYDPDVVARYGDIELLSLELFNQPKE
jgi:dCMP deaminase